MKEHLFRAWDAEEKKFVYSNNDDWSYEFRFEGNKLICYKQYEYCDTWGDEHMEYDALESDVERWTGVADKNENQIFEGDRIRFMDVGEEGYEYKDGFEYVNEATVIWDNERMGWALTDFEEYSDFIPEVDSYDYESQFKAFEVIGNIHDMPELLEVGDEG